MIEIHACGLIITEGLTHIRHSTKSETASQ